MRIAASLLMFVLALFAGQNAPSNGGNLILGTIAATGQVGQYVSYANTIGAPAMTHAVNWTNAGTAPSVCTFQVETSSDAVHWYAVTTSTSCTSPNRIVITYSPGVFVRVDALTYTAGDGTTAVAFSYTRGQ